MVWFSNDSDQAQAFDKVNNDPPDPTWSTELVAAAAAFEAAVQYEDRCETGGKPDNYADAKEMLMGSSGFIIDVLVETKGLDFVDRDKAKSLAMKQNEDGLTASGQY